MGRLAAGFADALAPRVASASTGQILLTTTPRQVYNLTDATTPTYTLTNPGGGDVQLFNPLANRDVIFATGLGSGRRRITMTATIISNAGFMNKIGFAIRDSSGNWMTVGWGFNGSFAVKTSGGGNRTPTGFSTYTNGDVLTLQLDISGDGFATITVSKNGGSRLNVGIFSVPLGDVYYFANFGGSGTVRLSLAQSSVSVAPVISQYTGAFTGTEVSWPSGFAPARVSTKLKVGRKGDGTFSTTLNLAPPIWDTDHTAFLQYVDPVAGLDTNVGTSASPLKSVAKALTNCYGSRAIIKCKGGLYDYTTGWTKAEPSDRDGITQVVSWDGLPVVLSAHDPALVWTLNSGSTYQATYANVLTNVVDAANLTADGDYTPLAAASTLAMCQAAQGVTGTTSLVQGSGGTDGQYGLGISGGGGTLANGIFTVSGGKVVSVQITYGGIGYTSAPTLSFSNCAGLTGASATAVIGNVGAFFASAGVVYVTTVDRRVPDSNIRVYKTVGAGGANGYIGKPSTCYIENLCFEGGYNAFNFNITSFATSEQATFYAKYCTFKYCNGGSGAVTDGDVIAIYQKCIAAHNSGDNFHANPASAQSNTGTLIELDCISRWAGYENVAQDNASSNHGGDSIRIKTTAGWGDYHHSKEGAISDVFSGRAPLSWHLGITVRDSRTNANANLTIANGGTMWNDSVVSSGATYDFNAVGASDTIYKYNVTGGAGRDTGSGTINTYTP